MVSNFLEESMRMVAMFILVLVVSIPHMALAELEGAYIDESFSLKGLKLKNEISVKNFYLPINIPSDVQTALGPDSKDSYAVIGNIVDFEMGGANAIGGLHITLPMGGAYDGMGDKGLAANAYSLGNLTLGWKGVFALKDLPFGLGAGLDISLPTCTKLDGTGLIYPVEDGSLSLEGNRNTVSDVQLLTGNSSATNGPLYNLHYVPYFMDDTLTLSPSLRLGFLTEWVVLQANLGIDFLFGLGDKLLTEARYEAPLADQPDSDQHGQNDLDLDNDGEYDSLATRQPQDENLFMNLTYSVLVGLSLINMVEVTAEINGMTNMSNNLFGVLVPNGDNGNPLVLSRFGGSFITVTPGLHLNLGELWSPLMGIKPSVGLSFPLVTPETKVTLTQEQYVEVIENGQRTVTLKEVPLEDGNGVRFTKKNIDGEELVDPATNEPIPLQKVVDPYSQFRSPAFFFNLAYEF
jgi:hypothetical protein